MQILSGRALGLKFWVEISWLLKGRNFRRKIATYENITQRQMDAHLPLGYFFVGADFSAEGADFSAEIAVSRSHVISTQIL